MPDKAGPDSREIRRGRIYRNVFHKRVDERDTSSYAELGLGRIEDGVLVFDEPGGLGRALTAGVFRLEIPVDLDVLAGDRFARKFYLGSSVPPYGRFREISHERFEDPLLGFHQRVNQIEQFLLERRFWADHYPPEISELGEAMTRLARLVLRSVLRYVDIPVEYWRRATGGCSDASGSYHLTFNHYRPAEPDVGLNSHKDDGFITLLRTTAPGLEVNRADHWELVPVDPSCLIVNFGLSMELLTACCETPVAAIMHRVAHQVADRVSFGHFSSSRCDPGTDEGIYRYRPGIGLDRVCGARELIDVNDYEIYEGTEEPGGTT